VAEDQEGGDRGDLLHPAPEGIRIVFQFLILLKKLVKKTSAVAAILLIFFSPFLLLIDFEKFVPLVLTIWLLSAVYFVFVKSRH
jgi:hypothetical protein